MTDQTTHSEPDATASEHRTAPSDGIVLTDPSSLADREDVDHREHTFVHVSEEHCEADFAGRAVVGVTNDAGELLLRTHRESGGVVLPNGKVEQGEDWAAAGVWAAQQQTGIDVDVEAVERVRHVEHRVEGAASPFDATTHVVFRAAPTSTDDPTAESDEVTVGWHAEVPDDVEGEDRPAVDDVRLFLD